MLPQHVLSTEERRLLKLFRSLEATDRDTLVAFGEFLSGRTTPEPQPDTVLEPEPLARPQRETVVAAIKRLRRTYHMLDHGELLNETSFLMSSHVLQGRAASEVIDELEALFARYYAAYRDRHSPTR